MGCGGSKQTKVVKFKEPTDGSPSNKAKNQTSAPSPAKDVTAQPEKFTTPPNPPKIEVKDVNNNKPELTPVIELPKNEANVEPVQESGGNVASKLIDKSNVEVKPITDSSDKKSERKPILNGTLETRNTVINSKISRVYSPTKLDKPSDVLRIIHFNDVYNIEPREQEPVGGAARFVTKVRSFENEPMVLFSGDLLNPSLMSNVTKGKQMVPVINAIGVHTAVYGNHDFDFGVDELIDFKNNTKFPWLMSNVQDKLTQTLLADGVEKVVAEWHGHKIGIIGLVEKEWLVTLSALDADDIEYTDFIDSGRALATSLREEEGCEYIIALTHMRVPNDTRLLEADIGIDLILGGHDHHYEVKEHGNKVLVKSGTDFRELSEITIDFANGNKVKTKRHEINADIEENEEIKKECEKYMVILGQKMEEELGLMHVDLDGRFSTVRTKESNLGNFITDIMRAATQTDIAFLNSGSLRSDCIHPTGPFKMKDLVSVLPMVDMLVVIKMTGQQVIEALENSVSQYPKFEGRFLQVSGIRFAFDPDQPEGDRVVKETVMVHDNIPINLEYEYKVVTKEYLARGKDGFDVLKDCPVLVDAENGPVLLSIVENHFESIRIYKGKRKSVSGHRQSITVKHDEQQTFMEKQRSRLSPQVEGRIRLKGDPEVLSPTFVRRKSKLRAITPALNQGVSTGTLGAISEDEGGVQSGESIVIQSVEGGENAEPGVVAVDSKGEMAEEVDDEDDSDIESVMTHDDNLEQVNDDDRMRMWEAVGIDDVEKLSEIVHGRNLDFRFWIMEKTILHHAAQHNSVKCLEYLLKESNLKVDVRDQILKSSALYYASEHGSREAALLLLDNGAKVNSRNALWETPLHVACENGKGSLIIVLLSRGADRTIKNKEGQKPRY
eukprot:TCONS_00060812-protein